MKDVFSNKHGESIYSGALRAIDDYHMLDRINGGVLIGLSGGADSVMLLLLLLKIKSLVCDFPLVAVHINHMIRGNEADRDENFSKSLCESLGVEFRSISVNVPKIASEQGISIEEAARNARYSAFFDIIKADQRISTVAVAHNATDNLETVIFNMMRGSGLSGICGIPPVRDNIIRPLIYSSKQQIIAALDAAEIGYVTDSTNADVQYTRNYVRHEIVPRLSALNEDPEAMVTRMCQNLRDDNEYMSREADRIIESNMQESGIPANALTAIPKSLFYRVLLKMVAEKSGVRPEKTHVDAIYDLVLGGNFSYSLPGKIRFVMENGLCYIGNDIVEPESSYSVPLKVGVNEIPGYSTVVILSDDKTFENYSNIYKISIQQQIPSDIIDDGLCVRSKKDGDSYVFGGMTRKLKKLFNDRKISPSQRQNIPVISDKNGIVWVPGFKVRDGLVRGSLYIAFAEPICCDNTKKAIYFKAER